MQPISNRPVRSRHFHCSLHIFLSLSLSAPFSGIRDATHLENFRAVGIFLSLEGKMHIWGKGGGGKREYGNIYSSYLIPKHRTRPNPWVSKRLTQTLQCQRQRELCLQSNCWEIKSGFLARWGSSGGKTKGGRNQDSRVPSEKAVVLVG